MRSADTSQATTYTRGGRVPVSHPEAQSRQRRQSSSGSTAPTTLLYPCKTASRARSPAAPLGKQAAVAAAPSVPGLPTPSAPLPLPI
eukprot:6483301-Pyramimonas_sp.AAC.2